MPPLEGITVLDFSHALAGPYCTMLMAAYGARVIKIENPSEGDVGRSWGPPFQGGEASFFLGLNSGKQSLSIDLKHAAGLDLCRRLAGHADILVENFRPGTMNRLGLDYATVAGLNPRLIYVSISGYGQTGPRSNEPLMDLVAQAAAGLMSFTGTPEGETVRSGHSVADVTAGMFALIGAMLALEARHRRRPVCRRFHDRYDDVDDGAQLRVLPWLGKLSGPAWNQFCHHRAVSQFQVRGPRNRHRRGERQTVGELLPGDGPA
jgi:crotonobetainyl-CoA:carnitine CoA-transferase CaiB-like acyl-CoA transferase